MVILNGGGEEEAEQGSRDTGGGSGNPTVETPEDPQNEGGGSGGGAPDEGGGEPSPDNQPISEGDDPGDGSGSVPPEGEPQTPDPLGLQGSGGEQGGDLDASLENTGIRNVATRFVSAAYGYEGSDAEEYASGVAALVEPGVFPDSPGGRLIDRNRDRIASGGSLGGAARLEAVEFVREVPFSEISPPLDYQDEAPAYELVVRYSTGENFTFDESGEAVMEGGGPTYEQRMIVIEKPDPYDPDGGRLPPGWRLVTAETPEEV